MRISICTDTQRTGRRCSERVATGKQRSQPSVKLRIVDNGKGGPIVGTPKRHGGLMTGRSAKGRKETKGRKKEKRTKGGGSHGRLYGSRRGGGERNKKGKLEYTGEGGGKVEGGGVWTVDLLTC